MADFTYPLPRDTVLALEKRGPNRRGNPGLLFERFSPDVGAVGEKEAGAVKRQALERVRGCRADPRLLEACRIRWRATAAAMGAITFQAETVSRVVVGLGRKGPLEVGFTFHRLYGFPIIPGSALKGLARARALLEKEGNERDDEVVAVFGREPDRRTGEDGGCAGRAVFLDAIPAGSPALELDIMNPHYPGYYRDDGTPPTDWQKPTPVYFLAVASQTPFLFAVGWRGGLERQLQPQAVQWLLGGLTDLGVGAKTTAGYGYFAADRGEAAVPTRGTAAAAEKSPADLPWRKAVVRVHRSGQGGTIVDVETGELIAFGPGTEEPRGTTFKTKAEVEYRAVTREGRTQVVSVRRVQEKRGESNG